MKFFFHIFFWWLPLVPSLFSLKQCPMDIYGIFNRLFKEDKLASQYHRTTSILKIYEPHHFPWDSFEGLFDMLIMNWVNVQFFKTASLKIILRIRYMITALFLSISLLQHKQQWNSHYLMLSCWVASNYLFPINSNEVCGSPFPSGHPFLSTKVPSLASYRSGMVFTIFYLVLRILSCVLRKTTVVIGMAWRGMKKCSEFRGVMVAHLTSNQVEVLIPWFWFDAALLASSYSASWAADTKKPLTCS